VGSDAFVSRSITAVNAGGLNRLLVKPTTGESRSVTTAAFPVTTETLVVPSLERYLVI
jgi:hypothetical protein